MARFAVLALALLASAFAAEEVCAEGQCAEGAEEAALLQSSAAQKLAEVKAHSNDTAGSSCGASADCVCGDDVNPCYYDPTCKNGDVLCWGPEYKCRFCGPAGPRYPDGPHPTRNACPSYVPTLPHCYWSPP